MMNVVQNLSSYKLKSKTNGEGMKWKQVTKKQSTGFGSCFL